MLNRIRNFVQSIRAPELHLQDLPLEIEIDANEKDQWIVSAHYTLNGHRQQADLDQLIRYGCVIQVNEIDYVVGERDLHALLAIKSLNPQFGPSHTWVCDVEPPILKYVRKRSNLKETSSAAEYKVLEHAIQPKAVIQLDEKKNLVIETGYDLPGREELILARDLNTTDDGKYVKVGKTFAPAPKMQHPAVDGWLKRDRTVIQHDNIPEFFKRDLVLLKSQLGAVLIEPVEQIRIIESNTQPRVTVDQKEPGWLDFQVDYAVGDVNLTAEAIETSGGGYFQPDNLTWVRPDPSVVVKTNKRLKDLGAEKTEDGYRLPIEQFGSLEEFIQNVGGVRELRAAYQDFLAGLSGFKASTDFRLPERLEQQLRLKGLTLYEHQRAGIHWLDWLNRNHLHGILADDMGLGKTLQSILAMTMAYKTQDVQSHSLIICPKSVMKHWEREIERINPNQLVVIYHGTDRDPLVWNHPKPVAFISTYRTVANDINVIQKQPLFYLILDEATAIKNPDTQRAKAMKSLNAAHRIALSGTPVENRPAELWSLFDFLMRGHLGTHSYFVKTFEDPIQAGDRQQAEALGKRIRPFVMRRLKSEVAANLPDKIEMDEWCELTDEQRQLYISIQNEHQSTLNALQKGDYIDRVGSILPILMKLKQICDHPALITRRAEPIRGRSQKFDWIVDKMKEITSDGEQVVIFSHYLDMLSLLGLACRDNGIAYMRIDGATSMVQRQKNIDDFNNGRTTVALCSLKAAGYGINLTAANHVIHADRWWNPAVEDQATDRVHRIGQEKLVYVYRILVQDTLEEKIDKLLDRKRGIADKVIGAATEGGLDWTREELIEILKPIG